MEKNNSQNVNIDEKLATLSFICDNKSHIVLDIEKCKSCKTKECLIVCPAEVYKINDDIPDIEYENCLECGTCRICCPKNAIHWSYPEGSKGVRYKFG